MKVLVTGATGFIGSHIADQMKEKGADVICIVRKTSNYKRRRRRKGMIVTPDLK